MPGEFAFGEVMARLKQALRLANDAALCRALGMSSSNYANRKKKGAIPWQDLARLAAENNVNMTWLLRGDGASPAPQASDVERSPYKIALDVGLLTDVIVAVDRELTERGLAASAKKRAQVIAFLYEHFAERGQIEGASFTRFMDAVLEQ